MVNKKNSDPLQGKIAQIVSSANPTIGSITRFTTHR